MATELNNLRQVITAVQELQQQMEKLLADLGEARTAEASAEDAAKETAAAK